MNRGLRGRSPPIEDLFHMKSGCVAALAGLTAICAQAQSLPFLASNAPLVVTATRALEGSTSLRDTVVISREELDAAGPLSLGELLERRAGLELRATGGPGQPQGVFIRGAGTAQTLVLVDGLRVGSATVGTTSIENIPLELVERIEVVKGPLSSLYGSDAIGGVVQVFTRGKSVPHLFASAGVGNSRERRLAAGVTAADGDTSMAISFGAREVDAYSATNPRASFAYAPDRDPHENAFANVRLAHRLWQGETVALEAFGSRARTRYDAGLPFSGPALDDRNDQSIAGARITSSNEIARGWKSRLVIGHGRDRIETRGLYPAEFETRQDQASWVNELTVPGAIVTAGAELLRQEVGPAGQFTTGTRRVESYFAGVRSDWRGNLLEASVRGDDYKESFGRHVTSTVGYGFDWPGFARGTFTVGRGFRAPTFFDLYAPASDFYVSNPQLRPEASESRELALRSLGKGPLRWRLAAYDNRIDDLIVFVAPTVQNVGRAEIRGVEGSLELTAWGARWRASATVQKPRDAGTGLALPGRARRFGTFEVERDFGPVRASIAAHASGERYDQPGERERLPGYATLDARVRYTLDKRWSIDVAATNLGDKRRETSVGCDAPRRALLVSVRFEAF
jgi:vitamin B12 transporter